VTAAQRIPALPARIRGRVGRTLRRRVLYRGDALQCPICGATFRRFLDFRGRPQAHCPACRSAERHRVLWLYLRDETSLLRSGGDVLHIAPEAGIARQLRNAPAVRYLSVDLDPARAMMAADITALPFPDGSFDVLLCSHVLEHVPDDRAALHEFRRVLRTGGVGYLQHPTDDALPRTIEQLPDPGVTPAQRLERFGHEEHLRTYGNDFPQRLEEAGFEVTVDRYVERLAPDVVRRHRLQMLPGPRPRPPSEHVDDVYVCRAVGSPT
jgi:SAM-dependent methyltransferase